MLSWLYDIKLDTRGVRFILLGIWTIYLLRFENIEYVTEIGRFSLGSMSAYNFKNRLFVRTFMIKMKQGWFTRKVLVTPKTTDEFLTWLMEHNVNIH